MTDFILGVMTDLRSRTEVLRNLTGILGLTRAQPGCSSCRLYCDIEEPKSILLSEEWLSQRDLEHRFKASDFHLILGAIDLSDGPPELHIDDVAVRGGMEVIECARQGRFEPRAEF